MLDKETQEELRKAEDLTRLTKSKEWIEAKEMLVRLMNENSSVFSIDRTMDPEQAYIEIGARQLAVDMVRQWISEVEGMAVAHEMNQRYLENRAKNELVKRT